MPTTQRARSGVPLDQRSVLASVPGVPAWGAFAIAAGATVLGIVVDAARGTELTSAFSSLYVIGCVAAVLLVRSRGLFTAMAQAPLIMFFAVPIAYQFMTQNAGTGIKDIILNVALPLVNRFPTMLLGTALALVIGGFRLFVKHQSSHARSSSTRKFAADTRNSRKTDKADAAAAAPTRAPAGRKSVWASEEDRGSYNGNSYGAAAGYGAGGAGSYNGNGYDRDRRAPSSPRAQPSNMQPSNMQQSNPLPRKTPPVQPRGVAAPGTSNESYAPPRRERFSTQPPRESAYGRTSGDSAREPRHKPKVTPPQPVENRPSGTSHSEPYRGYGRSPEQVGRFCERATREPYVAPRVPTAEPPHPVPRVRYRNRQDPNPDSQY